MQTMFPMFISLCCVGTLMLLGLVLLIVGLARKCRGLWIAGIAVLALWALLILVSMGLYFFWGVRSARAPRPMRAPPPARRVVTQPATPLPGPEAPTSRRAPGR